MKKRIAAVLAVVMVLSLLMGTVAYADNGSGSRDSQATDNGQPSDRAMERRQFLEKVKPLLQEIAANRAQIKTMREELRALRQQAKEHLKSLRQNPGGLTDEQIQLLKQLKTQLHECRKALTGTNENMKQQRQTLREMRRARNYEAVLAAYGNVITLQKERMEHLSKMKGIFEQIIAIG